MWRLLFSVVGIALTLIAQGSPEKPNPDLRAAFRSRYGEAYIQRYRLAARLRLTTLFGGAGEVCALQITSPGVESFAWRRAEEDLDSLAVDHVVGRFVAGYPRPHERGSSYTLSGRTVPLTWNTALVIEDFDGWQIAHEYRDPVARDKTIYATATAAPRCSPENRTSLEKQYGSPEYERLMVRPGLMLAVTYGEDRSVVRIDIRQYSAALQEEPYSDQGAIDEALAERLAGEILSPEVRKTLRPGFERITGHLGDSSRMNERVIVTRIFYLERVLGYSVRWR